MRDTYTYVDYYLSSQDLPVPQKGYAHVAPYGEETAYCGLALGGYEIAPYHNALEDRTEDLCPGCREWVQTYNALHVLAGTEGRAYPYVRRYFRYCQKKDPRL